MAHLSIGDKIPAHVSAQTSERGGKRTSSSAAGEEQRETSAPSDSVTLASGGPERLERPLGERIGNAADALGALRRLQSQMQEQPAAAVGAHAGIGQAQVDSLLRPPLT